MKKIISIILFIILGGFFICPNFTKQVSADSPKVIINELMWMGSTASIYDEWIELKNTTNQSIDISNWDITKKDSGIEKLMLTIPAGNSIPANDYFLISNYPETSSSSELNIKPNLEDSDVSLANSNLQIKLYDAVWNSGITPIDIADDGVGAPLAGLNDTIKVSMERNAEPEDGSSASDWHNSQEQINLDLNSTAFATPKNQNSETQQQPIIYPDQIFINEILPNPKDSDDAEFIELFNNNSFDVDLLNWQVGDNTTSRYTIKQSDFASTKILAKNYFLLPKSITNLSLNNDSDSVKLYQPNQILLDQISYAECFEGQSYNKVNSTWQWSMTLTPNSLNIISQNNNEVNEPKSPETILEIPKGPYSKKIIISEILPNPTGSDNAKKGEFIEIKNIGLKTIDLFAWYIDDQKNGSKPYQIKTHLKIKPQKYLVFYKGATKLSLNNSNESARILWPDKKVAQEIKFTKSYEGQSYALKDNKWQWTTILTPGKDNEISEVKQENNETKKQNDETIKQENADMNFLSINEVRGLKRYDTLKTSGIVTVSPKTISQTSFYIQDETSGIQVYFSKKDFPDLKIGDKIEVAGKLSEASNEKRILISNKDDIKIIGNNQNLAAIQIETGKVSEDLEGKLVVASGQIEKSVGSTLYINDGSGTLKIYISSDSKIEKPKLKKGDWVTYQGIISETSSGYRLLPRFSSDIKAGKFSLDPSIGLTQIPEAGSNQNLIFISLIIIISYFAIKNPIKKIGHCPPKS